MGERELVRPAAVLREETAAGARRMPSEDGRLVAAFTMLVTELPDVIEELLARQLERDDRRALAAVFRRVVADLESTVPGEVLPQCTRFRLISEP